MINNVTPNGNVQHTNSHSNQIQIKTNLGQETHSTQSLGNKEPFLFELYTEVHTNLWHIYFTTDNNMFSGH